MTKSRFGVLLILFCILGCFPKCHDAVELNYCRSRKCNVHRELVLYCLCNQEGMLVEVMRGSMARIEHSTYRECLATGVLDDWAFLIRKRVQATASRSDYLGDENSVKTVTPSST